MINPERGKQFEKDVLKADFADKLVAFLEKENPDLLEDSLQNQGRYQEDVVNRESAVRDQEISSLLEMYGINVENIEYGDGQIFSLPLQEKIEGYPDLPEGYAYKGGMARALLLRNLGIESFAKPRDLDVVRIAEDEPYPGADDKVAKDFMPDDYEHGDGVEVIEDVMGYFDTRDFTINEVLAYDDCIKMTSECLLDTVRRIIRISEYENENADEEGEVPAKLLAKSLRFYSEMIARSEMSPKLENPKDWDFERAFISPFWLALNIDRAYDRGDEVAQAFFQQLKEKKQIPASVGNIAEAIEYLNNLIKGEDFYYRHAPLAQFEYELRLIEKFEEVEMYRERYGDQ